jgi:hypothetical protein
MDPQKFSLLGSQLKHKVVWEAVLIPFHSLIERLSFNSIKLGEVTVKHHLLTPNEANAALNQLHWHGKLIGCRWCKFCLHRLGE